MPSSSISTRKCSSAGGVRRSESDIVASLEREDFAGLGGCGDLEAEAFEDLADAGDLGGVGGGEHALVEPEVILQPHAHMAAHRSGLRRHLHLAAACTQHGPAVVEIGRA